ncbi:MAG: type II toxin-antitoxin system HicA family toxin [Elusimicrobia bacterium]|nr:type II toxin-antitoxin system HicA family toxin [Elusimicrobiota bacterium]
MSPKLPVVSSRTLVKFLGRLEYEVQRQRGSHIRLKKRTPSGHHSVTVPAHHEIARGTLNDILNSVSIHCQIPKGELINNLEEQN